MKSPLARSLGYYINGRWSGRVVADSDIISLEWKTGYIQELMFELTGTMWTDITLYRPVQSSESWEAELLRIAESIEAS